MNTRKLIELQAKNKSKLVKDAVSEIKAAPGSWQTLGFLNPSYVVIDFVDSSLKTLSLDWYTDWLKAEIAYQISANVVELIDEENGYEFDDSEYSEDIMRKVIDEYVHRLMPSYSTIQKYYKEFLKEAKECCPDEFEENKENISVKSFKKLYEANKYFFGAENPKEVKKLFESVEENKKEYYASMFRGLQHASADYMNKKLIDPISGFYEFQNWGVTLDASPIFGISKYIQNVDSEDLYTKYMSWYLFTHVFYLVMRACDEHQTSSGIKFDFLEYWWDLCSNRSIKSGDDKKFLKLFAKVFDLYYDMTFNQEKQVPSPVKKIVYKAISENV